MVGPWRKKLPTTTLSVHILLITLSLLAILIVVGAHTRRMDRSHVKAALLVNISHLLAKQAASHARQESTPIPVHPWPAAANVDAVPMQTRESRKVLQIARNVSLGSISRKKVRPNVTNVLRENTVCIMPPVVAQCVTVVLTVTPRVLKNVSSVILESSKVKKGKPHAMVAPLIQHWRNNAYAHHPQVSLPQVHQRLLPCHQPQFLCQWRHQPQYLCQWRHQPQF